RLAMFWVMSAQGPAQRVKTNPAIQTLPASCCLVTVRPLRSVSVNSGRGSGGSTRVKALRCCAGTVAAVARTITRDPRQMVKRTNGPALLASVAQQVRPCLDGRLRRIVAVPAKHDIGEQDYHEHGAQDESRKNQVVEFPPVDDQVHEIEA